MAIVLIISIILLFLLLAMIWKCFCCSKQPQPEDLRFNQSQLDMETKERGVNSNFAFRRGVSSTKPLFNWTDHPSVITEAVENGWSTFAFSNVGDHEPNILISWEVGQGYADFMQKIRINPGLKKVNNVSNNLLSDASVIKASLPLPGPPLAFPQDAYFEITIIETSKIIKEKYNARANSASLVHNIEGSRPNVKDDGKGEPVMISIGLTVGGSLLSRLPGSFPGSIGFNSNGSVFLDGIKLVFPSESMEWGRADEVIGCGFSPKEKKVFFTVDSELVHVIQCKTEEFGTPLYPTLAANADILVLVNFGQSVFSYAPANVNRTANPCFIGQVARHSSAAFGYEDSKELFSMGLIDSQWLNRSAIIKGNTTNSRATEESETDLFEIVLDSCGKKSPNTNISLPQINPFRN